MFAVPGGFAAGAASIREKKMRTYRMVARPRPSLAAWLVLAGLALCGPLAAIAQDADSGSGRVLTLPECIRLALDNSPTLLMAEEQRYIAGKDVSTAKGAFLPEVSLNRNWGESERTDFDLTQYTSFDEQYFTFDSAGDSTAWLARMTAESGTADETVISSMGTWSGGASLNLFNGFSKFANLSAAKHNLRAVEADLGYTREQVIQSVVTAYFNLLRYQKLAEVALETREQAAKELERTETYFRLGSAAKSNVLQQRVRLENTKLDLVVAQNNVKKAFADLAYAMNQPLAATFDIDPSVLATDFAIDSVEDLYSEALTNRLDLASSQHTLEARRKNITTASAGLWPSVNLSANYSRSKNESPYRFGAQESENLSWGYSVSWSVFDRMRTINGRAQAKANARIAEYQLEQARLNAQVEVRQLHNSLVEARERVNVSRETIEQSKEELRLAQERFRVGAGTTLDVIMAQVNLANSRAQEVQAMCDFLIFQSQLHRAVGRSAWRI